MKIEIKNMLHPEVYDHPVKDIKLIETHISWVILTGDFVYKIKKPVNFGFLDFSTLEKRHTYCTEELLLNRRMAPDIYLDVVSISGTPEKPVVNSTSKTFEYAVKMAQFPQSAQLDIMLADGELNLEHMDAIARMLADFHQTIEAADDSMDYGNNHVIYQPVEENFSQIREHLDITPYANTLTSLEAWCNSTFKKLQPVFEQRKRDGFVRECHGDIHLRNMAWLKTGPTAFDCIEFNAHLRWIDVISEIAFLVMDLQVRQQHQLANRFLNNYLEITGDYAGLTVMPFYLCYRALVRAKVNALRLDQKDITPNERQQSLTEFESHLQLATSYTQTATPKLIIIRGLSASGKSTISQQLINTSEMIRIRSDVERKRLFSIPLINNTPNGKKSDELNAGIYSPQASQQTYTKLAELALQVIDAGYTVIIDATFLKREQREPFQQLTTRLGLTYIILQTTAPLDILRQRIVSRKNDVSDADLVILEHQFANWHPLEEDENNHVLVVNTGTSVDIETLINDINAR